MNTVVYIAFLMLVVLASSCKKGEKETNLVPQQVKNYIDFPVGSYWVYEDTASGIIDSVYLESRSTEILDPAQFDYKYEELKQDLYSSYVGAIIHATAIISHTSPEYFKYHGHSYYFGDAEPGTQIQGGLYEEFYDSLNVGNVVYHDVRKILDTYANVECYWSSGCGMVQKVDSSDSKCWILNTYYINN